MLSLRIIQIIDLYYSSAIVIIADNIDIDLYYSSANVIIADNTDNRPVTNGGM